MPALQRAGGVASFFRFHLGHRFASSALMDRISKQFIGQMEQFAKQETVPVVAFEKGQRKDDGAAAYRYKFTGRKGVLFIGKAQEKTPVFRTERRAMSRPARPIRGWFVPPPWSITFTPTAWTKTRSFLSEVLHLLSLQCQALPERSRVRQTATGQPGDPLRGAG